MNKQQLSVLALNGLGVSFGQRVVLDGITLCLPPDGIDVLMGPVKTGKSTLLRTLSGMYEGHALHKSWGEARILTQPLTADNRPSLVLQHATALNLTLLQAMLEPIRKTRQHSPIVWRNLGMEWLEKYGLGESIDWADQPLLKCPTRLQRSITILAQALLNPPLLMIDEPTFSLNEADATWLLDWMKQLSTHCKLWVSLHNQSQARRLADRIVLLGGGRVIVHQDTAQFFQQSDNEWVNQFVRTGSFALPSPGTLTQDLATDAPRATPLSMSATQAIHAFKPQASTTPSVKIVAPPPVSPAPSVVQTSVEAPRLVTPPPAAPAPQVKANTPNLDSTRKLAALPSTSRYGVEQAAAVGNVFFHDSSAPRGFHWIVPGKLAGCPAPGVIAPIHYDLSLLAKTGITKLVTLTEVDLDQDALHKAGLSNLVLSVPLEAGLIFQQNVLFYKQIFERHLKNG